MPAKEIDYSTTVIYKIVCNDLAITDLYVGHTTNFRNRKSCHKYSCSNETNEKYTMDFYKTIRDNGGWFNWSMLQIEAFPCANGNEAKARERYWIEELNAKLNISIPNRSKPEWYEQNKDRLNDQKKEYKKINKDKIKQQNAEYMAKNKDKIKQQNAKYRELNTDKIRENRNKNKDKYKESTMKQYNCECGSTCKMGNRSDHFKSKKHLAFIAQKDNIET
jgi:hypothetical protein